MTGPGEPELVARAAVAAGLGAALGVERALHGKESGIRTLCLVALGACAFALAGYGFDVPGSGSRPDPSRIAAQVASGIGFLGAVPRARPARRPTDTKH